MQKSKAPLWGALVSVVLFGAVIWMTTVSFGINLDEKLVAWADQQTEGVLYKIVSIMSLFGESEIILILTVLVGLGLLIRFRWRQLFFFFVVSVGGVALNLVLKLLIHRGRPGDEAKYIDVFNYQFELQSYSFPSGHTMRAVIFFLFIMYLAFYYLRSASKKFVFYLISGLLIIGVAVSRVMLEAHFLTDVLGAIFIGTAWFLFVLYFFHKPKDVFFSTLRF